MGKPRWLVRFFCKEHSKAVSWSLLTSNLFQYRIMGKRDQGSYTLEKLTPLEQNHRAILREKADGGRIR
jgi:hypothetical protein